MSVPSWVRDSVFYQIFPDRFYNGDPNNDPPNLMPWGAKPTINGFHGGDLRGVIDRMYYLLDLGINAIYFTPIFLASSTHRYNATDYFQVDYKLGTHQEFKTLLDVAHRNQIKIVLDGVFNHCGRGFFAFSDILENQASSPYSNWFHIKQFPVDAYSPGDATSYEGWWKYKSLPKFNTSNPKVKEYIFNVTRYWLEQGIDGWRLDVPNEIDDDNFWSEFRHVVKRTNPEAYLVGEIWDGDPRWVGDNHFDGLMHYPIRTLILDLLSEEIDAARFSKGLLEWFKRFPSENSYSMYTTLGSHDTERLFTLLNKDITKTKMAFFLLFTYPGAPAIYYGDEIGIEGGRDPDSRRTFPWDETTWKVDLRQYVKALIKVRNDRNALRRGDFKLFSVASAENIIAFTRIDGNDTCIVLGNASDQRKEIKIDVSALLKDVSVIRNLLGSEKYQANNGKIDLDIDPWSGVILTPL